MGADPRLIAAGADAQSGAARSDRSAWPTRKIHEPG